MKYSDGTKEEEDDVFATAAEAEEYGLYLISCHHTGSEILHMSNPGDHPLSDADEEPEYEVISVN